MKNVLDEIKTKAKALHKKIVLCEGEDKRVVKAAPMRRKEGIAQIVLLGDEAAVKAANPEIDLTGVTIVNPLTSPRLAEYNAKLCELRASKGMTAGTGGETSDGRNLFRRHDAENGRGGRTCFRSVPFDRQYTSSRTSDHKDPRREFPPFPVSIS